MTLSLESSCLERRAKSFALCAGIFTAALGLAVLAGWAFDLESVKRVFPDLVAMNPLTAVCFVLLGAASALQVLNRFPKLFSAFAILTLALSFLTLLEYVFPAGLNLDQRLFASRLDGNVMAPNTALNFVFCSLSFLLVRTQSKTLVCIGQFLLVSVFMIALFALAGYAFGVRAFYRIAIFIPMALHVAAAFLLLSLSILNLRLDEGWMRIFISSTAGGFMARRLLPAVIVIPLGLTAFRYLGEKAGFYETEFGVALLAIANIVTLFILVMMTAQVVDSSDRERLQAEAKLKRLNDELEARVEQRTAALKGAQQQLIQQERLRALGQMASGIAHDFNNALSPILGYSELMLQKGFVTDGEKALQYLKTIHTAAKDAAHVVSRLREFYREKKSDEVFQPLDLNEVVRQAVVLTRPKWQIQEQIHGRDIRVELQLGEVPVIDGKDAEIREIMTNLIFNAVDAMPGGGTIMIRSFFAAGGRTGSP